MFIGVPPCKDRISNLTDENFDIKRRVLDFKDGRNIELPHKLIPIIVQLIEVKKSKKIKCRYFFYAKYEGKYAKLSDSTINRIISQLSYCTDLPAERKKIFIPSFIRYSSIGGMFLNGYSIDQIIYITHLNFTSMNDYISWEELVLKMKYPKKNPVHPYAELFF